MVDGIAFIVVLHLVENFWSCIKHMRLLVKNDKFLTRNVSLGKLKVRLAEICRNRELSQLKILLKKTGK